MCRAFDNNAEAIIISDADGRSFERPEYIGQLAGTGHRRGFDHGIV